jgi:shikimate kinase/3-dehydroquinate synthase
MKVSLDYSIQLPRLRAAYRVIVQPGSLISLSDYLAAADLKGRAFVITDKNVDKYHGKKIAELLSSNDGHLIRVPSGESSKSWNQAGEIIEKLTAHNAERHDTIIAFGGGVIGDLGGFVASIYNRGLPLVHVPTTLLAMVDSSIGGKTGINHGGKNKSGTFYQPRLVISDPSLLKTLDQRTYTEGLGEVTKYAMLNESLLSELQNQADKLRCFSPSHIDVLSELIAKCVQQKIAVVENDPYEQQVAGRELLNYGHTLAHALEASTNYKELLHGEAVAIGMNYAAGLAYKLGIVDEKLVTLQRGLLEKLNLPTYFEGDVDLNRIMTEMAKDKKGRFRFILPQAVEQMIVKEVDRQEVEISLSNFLTTR